MFASISDLAAINPSSTLGMGSVIASRVICFIPAMEMAIRTIFDLGEVINTFSQSPKILDNQADPLVLKEQEEQQEKRLKERRWEAIKTLGQDALGALFLGFCAFNPIPVIASAGAFSFLAYSTFNWKKLDASYSVKGAGISLKLLSLTPKLIIKALFHGAKYMVTSIAKGVQKVASVIINKPAQVAGSVAKAIAQIFKIAVVAPVKICAHGIEAFIKHPVAGIALVGAVALGILALQGTPLLAPLGTALGTAIAALANGAVVVGKALLPVVAKCTQVIFSAMFSVAKSLAPIAFAALKMVPTVLQFTVQIIWKIFAAIVGGAAHLLFNLLIG